MEVLLSGVVLVGLLLVVVLVLCVIWLAVELFSASSLFRKMIEQPPASRVDPTYDEHEVGPLP